MIRTALEQIRRERETESEVRALGAVDIVAWIHRLEDEREMFIESVYHLLEYVERVPGYRDSADWISREELIKETKRALAST